MEYVNPLLQAWSNGRTTLGTFVMLPSQVGAEVMAGPGIDLVCVDLQHGNLSVEDFLLLVPAIAAQGAVPVARVEANDPTVIGHALDAGAAAVVVPLVDDADGARRAVAACRFPPNGVRSYGPARFGVVSGAWEPADVEKVACIVMIETAEGLANVREIAATPGVDGILIGPSDLAIAHGISPWVAHQHETVQGAIATIRAAATDAGIITGIVCGSGQIARPYIEAGLRMVCIATDVGLLLGGLAAEVQAASGEEFEADASVEAIG